MKNFIRNFKSKIKKKELKIAVVGLGYVGLPLAIEFAKKGFFVLGLDLDEDRIAKIQKKQSYITDVSSGDLKKVIDAGKFKAGKDFRPLRQIDVILICVPTPLKKRQQPDISYIESAVTGISGNLKKNALVILESTTYPGTTEEVILPFLERNGLRHGKDFFLCFSPERIDPGNTDYHICEIPKVVGGLSPEAGVLAESVYKIIISKVVPVSSPRVAETVKLLENTFRIVNIGMIDEIAMMCHKMNIDIWEVVNAAKTKPFGFMPFYPGPGVGGHCIPKDPLYLYWKAKKFGFKSRFIRLSSEIISGMPQYVIDRAISALEERKIKPSAAKILVIGATYKKDIKDLRQSPALDIIAILENNRIKVSYHDPLIPYLKVHSTINLKSIDLTVRNLSQFDCVIIATDHSNIDYKFLLQHSRLIFDTRNVYAGTKSHKVIRL